MCAAAAAATVVVVVHGEGDGEENDRVPRRDVSTESGGTPVVEEGMEIISAIFTGCLKPEEMSTQLYAPHKNKCINKRII